MPLRNHAPHWQSSPSPFGIGSEQWFMESRATRIALGKLLLGAMLAGLAASSQAAGGAAVPGPAVVELYTSEGCSSCPPAEAVLGTVSLRPEVIALAFHVTYWDSAAWRDRFGRPDAADRQARYVRALGLPSAYTPQAVVNGSVDEVGSDAAAIARSITNAPRPAQIVAHIDAHGLAARLPALPSQCPCTLRLIGTLARAETAVAGGENDGRRVREFSIVRSIENAGGWNGAAAERVVSLSGVPADASTIVLLAERNRDMSIVAAGQVAIR
jgi:hypothetical protein